jgi:hypothetical protein
MQKNSKILKYIFSLLIATQIAGFLFFIPMPVSAEAQWKNPFDDLQVKIPGLEKFSEVAPCPDDPTKKCVKWIGEYIAGLYKYAIGIVGILAAVVLMIGGVIWITAGGNQTRVGEARAWIGASLTGLIIALTSYMILYQVNPDLVNFRAIVIPEVKEMGCCEKTKSGGSCSISVNKDLCESGWKGKDYFCNDEGKCKKTPTSKLTTASGCCIEYGTSFPTKCYDMESKTECEELGKFSFESGDKCEKSPTNNIKTCVPK